MDDDPDEIYSAPTDNVKSSFADIRKAFEAKQMVPMKVATDGRYQSKDVADTTGITRTKTSIRPAAGTKPLLFNNNNPPGLPLKKTPKKSDSGPPSLPDKASSTIGPGLLSKRASDRPESMFPPTDDKTPDISPSPSSHTAQRKDRPLPKPLNGIINPGLPPRTNEGSPKNSTEQIDIVHTPKGAFKKRPLPPAGRGPPSKPTSVPASEVRLPPRGHPVLTPARSVIEKGSDDGVEPEEIYDDISNPLVPDSPTKPGRPVSMIPEMTEDDELSDGEKNRQLSAKSRLPAVPSVDSDQETYDDVAPGSEPSGPRPPVSRPPAVDADEEIYEDI